LEICASYSVFSIVVDVMDNQVLLTLAEVTVGLLGFSAIATALNLRSKKGLAPYDKIRLYWIVFTCLIIIVGCFIPFWTARFFEAHDIWYWSTIFYISEVMLIGVVVISPIFSGFSEIKEKGLRWGITMLLLSVFNLVPVIFNLASWPLASNQMFYEIAMLMPIFQVVWTFIDLVANPSVEDQAE
jgi:hypothetical protein